MDDPGSEFPSRSIVSTVDIRQGCSVGINGSTRSLGSSDLAASRGSGRCLVAIGQGPRYATKPTWTTCYCGMVAECRQNPRDRGTFRSLPLPCLSCTPRDRSLLLASPEEGAPSASDGLNAPRTGPCRATQRWIECRFECDGFSLFAVGYGFLWIKGSTLLRYSSILDLYGDSSVSSFFYCDAEFHSPWTFFSEMVSLYFSWKLNCWFLLTIFNLWSSFRCNERVSRGNEIVVFW